MEKFEKTCTIRPSDFIPCTAAPCGEVCAVDGSNVMLLESGSMALAVVRAAQTTFIDMERSRRSVTPMTFAIIGPEEENQDFPVLYADCFGHPPGKPLVNEDITRAAGILRDTVEYWVTETMAKELGTGALLLRDGPLRVSHESHNPVLTRIALTCKEKDIGLAGISKRSAATWGGGHPLLPCGLRVRGDPRDQGPVVDQNRSGHPRPCSHSPSGSTGRCTWPASTPGQRGRSRSNSREAPVTETAKEIMNRLAGCSADGRIPGYPYPLFDAHRTVVLTEEIVEQVKGDLLRTACRGRHRSADL